MNVIISHEAYEIIRKKSPTGRVTGESLPGQTWLVELSDDTLAKFRQYLLPNESYSDAIERIFSEKH